jgi:hypothetical protein
MRPEDYRIAALIVRKYAAAVETKLYWEMSTSTARGEIAEAKKVAEMLETEKAEGEP